MTSHFPGNSVRIDPRYVEARRVLLDALDALSSHADSLTLVGAQAVYLHTGQADLAVAPFTTDGDLAVNPHSLGAEPTLEAAMTAAGFRLSILDEHHVKPGIWVASATVGNDGILVPVDLIVPEGFAPAGGRRGARLGPHGKQAARRAVGLEAALIDRAPMTITALDPADTRAATIGVAGVAALLVAKAHKINDRVHSSRRDRLGDKDGADVIRLMGAQPATETAEGLRALLEHAVAGPPTRVALRYLNGLFGRRGRPGIQMASRALRGDRTEEQLETICVSYVAALRDALPGLLDAR